MWQVCFNFQFIDSVFLFTFSSYFYSDRAEIEVLGVYMHSYV